jgi:transcriptional regulator with PAS, ATPase and Fis domain
VPPLRERKEDIPLLAEHFIQKYGEKNQQHIRKISPQMIDLFMRYLWPGNIRELENVIQRAVILCKEETLMPDVLPPVFKNLTTEPSQGTVDSLVGLSIKEVERELIKKTLEQTNHNITRTAEILGITRRGLQYKLNELGL